jgi:hypothetical protein
MAVMTDEQPEPQTFRKHDVVLQTLNREHNGLFLTEGAFAPTLNAWNGVPIIYANAHIDPKAYDANPEAELARVGGRVVGTFRDPRIEHVGHPNIRGKLDIKDAMVDALIEAGRVTPSSAFFANPEDQDPSTLSGPVKPHHVLLFPEGGPLQPGDKGALILNTKRPDNMVDETESKWQALKAAFMAFLQPAKVPDPNPQQPDQDRSAITPDNTKVAMLEAEIASYKQTVEQAQKDAKRFQSDLEAANAKIAAVEQEKKDAKWAAFKEHVPKGMLADEPKTRAEFEADPAALGLRVVSFLEQRPPERPEEGQTQTPPPPPPADPNAPYMTVEAPQSGSP